MNDPTNIDTPRTALEIARRVIVLHCVIAAAHGVSKQDMQEWLLEEHLWAELTPWELQFMTQSEPSEKAVIRMTWFVEAQAVLLWSIGKLDDLPPPTQKCDTGLVIAAMPDLFEPTAPFIDSALLRPAEAIEREELISYDIRGHIHQAIRKGQAIPEGYDMDAVFFRHYGFNWVLGYCGQSWDEVTPDI